MRTFRLLAVATAAVALVTACANPGSMRSGDMMGTPVAQAGSGMSFFVTSANPGRGADFGGLAGADRYCQTLASTAGAGNRNWRAYLSTTGAGSVNARDRIGRGPWQNAKGQVVATSVDELHGTNQLTRMTALDERGNMVNGRTETPNMHDVLTGSGPDGRAMAGADDTTCGNWTKSGDGAAIVGHHDRQGLRDDTSSKSWNSSHPSRGCGLEALKGTGGDGRLYCFAAN
jgi:hypothetical protein